MTSTLAGLAGFVVLFVCGALLLRWLQKRLGGPMGSGSRDIRILRRVPIGWQCMLVVVDIAGRQYALTTSRHGGVTVIDELAEPLAEQPPAGDFTARLKTAIQKRRERSS
ncbi:FliO/MopB family protein [Salinisphaera sp. RV14]|uniref:FliO/MopB family protein n=1 Tax=unclassified Salinisphaera TaxID=2649847 RepID=UPI003F8703A6